MIKKKVLLISAIALVQSCLPMDVHAAVGAHFSITDADSYLIKNQFKQAEEAYRSLIEGDENGDAYAGLAVSLAQQNVAKKVLEAEKILRQARDKYADNPNVIAAAGFVSYVHSKTVASPAKRDLYLEAAETLCKRAIKANSDILIAQQTLGLVKIAQDDIDDAIEPFKKAVALCENPINLTLLAQALLRLSPKDKDADELVNKAINMQADYYPAHLQKAIVLLHQGKPEEAYTDLHSIPNGQRNADWYTVEGDIYRKQGDGPAALASWREAIRLDPRSPEPYRRLAESYALRGDGELAIAEMHSALEILPNDMAMRSQLAELALRQDKLDVAETEYRTILAAQPSDASALLGLSRVYFRKARKEGQYPPGWQKLMDQLQNVVTEESVKGEVISGARNLQQSIQLSEAAKALSRNHFRQATQLFSNVISNHKEEPYELLTLGEQAFNDGDLRAAEQAFTLAKEIPEVSARAEQGISKIVSQRNEAARHTKLGDATWKMPEVAMDHYKQALIADPQCPHAYYGLFALFSRSENTEPGKAMDYAMCFLEAADDANPLRKEVESSLIRLRKRVEKAKPK